MDVAPVVAALLGSGRSADAGEVALLVGLEGSDGDEGEGESKGVSESKSASGVVTGDAMARDRCAGWRRRWRWERPGGGGGGWRKQRERRKERWRARSQVRGQMQASSTARLLTTIAVADRGLGVECGRGG